MGEETKKGTTGVGRAAQRLFAAVVLFLTFVPTAFAADCLEYEFFFRHGGVFPNPYNNYTDGPITGRVTLLVVDEDLNMHLARLRRTTFNDLGQTVDDGDSIGHYESRRSVLVSNLWGGRNDSHNLVASGVYRVLVNAESTVCGAQSHSIWSTVLH